MPGLDLDQILRAALKVGASDIHLKVARTPVFRIDGKLVHLKGAPEIKPQDKK